MRFPVFIFCFCLHHITEGKLHPQPIEREGSDHTELQYLALQARWKPTGFEPPHISRLQRKKKKKWQWMTNYAVFLFYRFFCVPTAKYRTDPDRKISHSCNPWVYLLLTDRQIYTTSTKIIVTRSECYSRPPSRCPATPKFDVAFLWQNLNEAEKPKPFMPSSWKTAVFFLLLFCPKENDWAVGGYTFL